MFAFQRNMFNIDILFNDKTSAECFNNSISIDDIVSGVVSGRFNDKFVLDLSNFCNDPGIIYISFKLNVILKNLMCCKKYKIFDAILFQSLLKTK